MPVSRAPLSVYYHTHWDREWYLPFRAYQIRLAQVVDELLPRLEQGEPSCFMLDGQTVILDDYLELRPQHRNRLAALIAAGQLSIGPWFVMPDEFLVSGESLVRNLALGIETARAWGCQRFTGYLPDTFGHSADIPTILAGCQIQTSVIWRGAAPPHSLFQWQSPSGATVTTWHLLEGYFQMGPDDWTLSPAEQRKTLEQLVQRLHAQSNLAQQHTLLPIGADHMASISPDGLHALRAWFPHLHETTPDRFFEHLSVPHEQPVLTGELLDNQSAFVLPGVWSSRLYLKQANRRLEHMLTRKIEPVLAWAYGPQTSGAYPHAELALAWKLLMLNHPHDSICGCSVDSVHQENEHRFSQVQQVTESLMSRATQQLQAQSQPHHWLFLNTSDQPYTGVVPVCIETHLETVDEDEVLDTRIHQRDHSQTVLQDDYQHHIRRIPLAHLRKNRHQGWVWVNQLPALSASHTSANLPRLPQDVVPVDVGPNHLRNGYLDITIQPNGQIDVLDSQTQQVYHGLLKVHALAEQGDSYNSAPAPGSRPVHAQFRPDSDTPVTVPGPLVGEVQCLYVLQDDQPDTEPLHLHLAIWLRLQAGCPWLELEIAGSDEMALYHKVQLVFETGQPVTHVQAESHYSLVTRHYPTPEHDPYQAMPVSAGQEIMPYTGPIQRFVSANGHSWITEGLTEYEIFNTQLAITLVRPFDALSKADTGARGAQAGPPLPTPEGRYPYRPITGRLAWLPTPSEPHTLYHQANLFYGSVWGHHHASQTGQAAHPPQSPSSATITPIATLPQWGTAPLVSTACYLSGGDLIMRLLNPQNQPISAQWHVSEGSPYRHVRPVNLLGLDDDPAQTPQPLSASPRIQLGPFGVQTYRFTV